MDNSRSASFIPATINGGHTLRSQVLANKAVTSTEVSQAAIASQAASKSPSLAWLGWILPIAVLSFIELAAHLGWIQARLLPPPSEIVQTLSALIEQGLFCLLYTSPSPRDRQKSRMPSSA